MAKIIFWQIILFCLNHLMMWATFAKIGNWNRSFVSNSKIKLFVNIISIWFSFLGGENTNFFFGRWRYANNVFEQSIMADFQMSHQECELPTPLHHWWWNLTLHSRILFCARLHFAAACHEFHIWEARV